MTNRPTSVLILCIVTIALSLLGLCGAPFGVLPYVTDFGVPNPVVDMVKESMALLAYMMFSMCLGLILNAALLACSIGAVLMKSWGRYGMMVYAVISLFMGLIGMVVNFAVLMPKMRALGDEMVMFGATGGVIGGCIAMLLPVAILVVMLLPGVREAYQQAGESEEGEPAF